MQEVTFTLRTLTPLLMAGANQHVPELRSPSFRGLMRYWQRALVGGRGKSLKEVTEVENAVFGSTEQGSTIQIRVLAPNLKPTRTINIRDRGMNYLLWPSVEKTNTDRSPRPFVQAKVAFQVKMSVRETSSTEELSLILKQAIAALWLLANFGSIGFRSRHGAGNLEIESITNTSTIEDTKVDYFSFDQPTTITDLKNLLEQGLREARELYHLGNFSTEKASFEVLSSHTCNIWMLQNQKPWDSPTAALNAIGDSLRRYKIPPLQGKAGKRRASPLILRITKLQDVHKEQYAGIAILFKTDAPVPPGYYERIENWVRTNFPSALEVTV